MRDLLAHADLARYAGQFVWLELSYDEAENRAFMTKYGAESTPTFFVIDPQDEHVVAMQPGAMSLAELTQFLERGKSGVLAKSQTPAVASLTRGDALLAQQPADAAKAYEEALRLAPPLGRSANSSRRHSSRRWKTADNGRNAPKPRQPKRPL